MSADIHNKSFNKEKQYRRVIQQQGRVQLDADFNEDSRESDLPKPDEPLNCVFQRREGKKDIKCALIMDGASDVSFTRVDRDICLIDICPMFQT